MWRLFFFGLIVWLAIYFLKQYIANIDSQKTNKTETTSHDNIENSQTTEDMVQCASCKVHLPRSEAFLVANTYLIFFALS
ncbi:MAG: PP0621 family protein [Methylotenera sp.]|nr:PP0621 family protein [Methylotenera sp.]